MCFPLGVYLPQSLVTEVPNFTEQTIRTLRDNPAITRKNWIQAEQVQFHRTERTDENGYNFYDFFI